mgnify:CR=1 FL=1
MPDAVAQRLHSATRGGERRHGTQHTQSPLRHFFCETFSLGLLLEFFGTVLLSKSHQAPRLESQFQLGVASVCPVPIRVRPKSRRYPNLAILAPVFCLARIKGKNIIVACSQFWSGCIQQGHKKYHTTCNHMLPRAPYLDQPGSSGNTPVRAPRNPGSTAGEVDRVPPSGTFESTRGKR